MSATPLLFALAAWFLGTGAVVWLDSRPRATFPTSLSAGAVVASAALAAVWGVRDRADAAGAYIGFAAAIIVWGWHEMAFLMGAIAGPNQAPCPAGATGWRRLRLATATVIHHELALAATLALIAAMAVGHANHAAMLAFALLFAMRLSAKLNLYLGVANLSDEVFPAHLAYLKTYFGERPVNALYPVSLALGTAAAWAAGSAANVAPPGSGGTVTATLVAGLAALGVVEHLFLVLPLKDGKLWRWAGAASNRNAILPGEGLGHGL